MAEGLADWLVMGLFLFLAGMGVSKSRGRALDVFGTQALARAPTFVTAIFALLPGYQRFSDYLIAKYTRGESHIEAVPVDTAAFALVALVGLVMLIWMVSLMYRAFTVACNVRGPKAIVTFVVVIIVGEAISKVVVFMAADRVL